MGRVCGLTDDLIFYVLLTAERVDDIPVPVHSQSVDGEITP